MAEMNKLFEALVSGVIEMGATRASVIEADKIETDKAFRDMCASNACGMYGKCWMCPPDVGEIGTLMESLKSYKYALVYQLVAELEDSFDFEGMVEAKKQFKKLTFKHKELWKDFDRKNLLFLGAGGCGVCETCTKKDGQPCRHPDLATPSLEAYGVNVSRLASVAGMKYINGANTVTYFGATLFND